MAKVSTFAGLEILDPGDPLSTNGYQFQGRDRQTIDQWLSQIPRHRHTGIPAISNPTQPPTVVASSHGGSMPGGMTAYVTFTVVDIYGGETTAAPVTSFTTPTGFGSGVTPITASLSNASGQLMINFYQYVYTLTDGQGGESLISTAVTIDRQSGPASAQVVFSGMNAIVAAAGAAGWRLYRATGGGQYALLFVGTGQDGFTDTGLIAVDYATQPPSVDTTNQSGSIQVTVPSAMASGQYVSAYNIYLSQTSTFADPSLAGTFPEVLAGSAILITSMSTQSGAPPPVSTAVQQPHQIDPDTELLNWHWKSPVAASAVLPSGTAGDVRLSIHEATLYAVLGSGASIPQQWTAIGSAGVGGGPDNDAVEDAGIAAASAAITALGLKKGSPLIVNGSAFTSLNFDEISLISTDIGGGSALATLGTVPQLVVSNNGTIYGVTNIEMKGSGGVAVNFGLDAFGDGIFTASLAPNAGITASAGNASAFVPALGGELDFLGSGGASAAVTSVPGGSARVTLTTVPQEDWFRGDLASGAAAGSAFPASASIGVARIAKFVITNNSAQQSWMLTHGFGTMQVAVSGLYHHQLANYANNDIAGYAPLAPFDPDWYVVDANNIEVIIYRNSNIGLQADLSYVYITVIG